MTESKKPSSTPKASKVVEPVNEKVSFYRKYHLLGEKLRDVKFLRDMTMGSGSRAKSYANTQQYKETFDKVCREVGLVFEMEFPHSSTENAKMPTGSGDKTIFLTTTNGTVTLTDLDTGFSRSYAVHGTAKNEAADHAALGAQTYAFRGWFLNTFLLNNEHDAKYEQLAFKTLGDVENAPSATEEKKPVKRRATPKRGTTKTSSSATETYAPAEMVADLGKKLATLRQTDPSAGEKFLDKFGEVSEDGTFTLKDKIPYPRAVSALQNIEEKLEEGSN